MSKSTSPTSDEIKQHAKAASKDLGDNAREMARDAAGAVRDQATHQAQSIKSGVADEASDVASALRKAANDMRDGSPQERTFGQIAGGLADVSDSIRGKDLGEVAHELSTFAKRNPMLFLGGVALAGFAATRFATASARRDEDARPQTASTMPSGPSASDATDSYTRQVPKTSGGLS